MYYFPVFINNRRYHYCKMLPAEAQESDTTFQFIVSKGVGSSATLFRITSETHFLSSRRLRDDITFHPRKMEVDCYVNADGEDPVV
ncbi:MAG: hypothetical protein AAF570_20075 [Bacteroidota bacterium]